MIKNYMFKEAWKIFIKNRLYSNVIYTSVALLIILFGINIYFIYEDFFFKNSNPVYALSFLLATFVAILVLSVLIISNRMNSTFTFIKQGKRRVSKLQRRIIVAFSIGAAFPTIIVATFSTYFFNFGIEAWFDKKFSTVLDQSIIVGESYIAEHVLQLKETAISVSDDLSAMYYDLIHNPELFTKVINTQAEMRSIDEAIVFQKNTNAVLAQTRLSFSLSFTLIPAYLISRADKGEIVQLTSDPTKIRILIKLRDYNDTYLLIGRLVDSKIIDHIDKTNGAATEYFRLKKKISTMQIKFSMIFILLSLILLIVAIIWGRRFAEGIVKPIRELIMAAEKVKNGNLSIQVSTAGMKKDEVKVLSSAFNRMISQIDRQQKELIVAHRTSAWSDLARSVAHEIKNPLTPIQLSAEMLLKKYKTEISDPKPYIRYIKNILKHSDDIKTIVSEFVDFARLPAPNFSECEIVSLLNDLVESRQLISDSISYKFISNVKKFVLVCDIAQMNRVIVNLLLNAEEAFEEENANKFVTVKTFVENNILSISVGDNGLGFSTALLSSAKDAYITTKSEGNGLGLAIVDRIVVDHLGSVNLSNSSEGGARVTLMFDSCMLRSKLK